MRAMTNEDLARIRAAIQLRDRCARVAVAEAERIGYPMSMIQARIAYDAMSPIICEAVVGRDD